MEVVSSPDTHDVTIIAVHIQRLLLRHVGLTKVRGRDGHIKYMIRRVRCYALPYDGFYLKH